jgi:hypothetical protein
VPAAAIFFLRPDNCGRHMFGSDRPQRRRVPGAPGPRCT